MPITQQQAQQAQAIQHAAAHDASQQVRLVAGPGTGKSFSIEERVRWLLENGIQANSIAAISFTRASSTELRIRIHSYCLQNNRPEGAQVRVSTLHSLALRILRAAGLLQQYPADPLVLDSWELENIFDAEFGLANGVGKERREEIRREHEAFWNTGAWNPANYIPPDPPITNAERQAFVNFHGPRTQAYSCVLPGEIVRQCLTQIAAGTIDPVALTHMAHLVVDEYQDLNSIDQQFVEQLIARGVATFVAGDDDQSIYSFRFASPAGIQQFAASHPGSGDHSLLHCFRCASSITSAANALINSFQDQNRIPKQLNSLYAASHPPVAGTVYRWRFNLGTRESEAIATSCQSLIDASLNPRDILILVSNQRELWPLLQAALDARGLPYESPRAEGFVDSEPGRFVLAVIRIVNDMNDYVAHRTILGLRPGVGIGTCATITTAVIANALNYRDIFYNALPAAVFNTRQVRALNHARLVCNQIAGWQANDTLAQRAGEIENLLTGVFNAAAGNSWNQFTAALAPDITMQELRDFLWADTDDQKMLVIAQVYARLNQPMPQAALLPPRIRVMSMHGAKGLSGRVVFIPGLEEAIFPGPRRQPYPGLVLEAARLLYVSITRARAACILTYAQRRTSQGNFIQTVPSRFSAHVDGAFAQRQPGLTQQEAQAILADIANL
jgi:superfamily I DNA/RNA helicase